MALIDRIADVNRRLPDRQYYRFYANGVAVGFVDTQFLSALPADLFSVNQVQRRVDCHFSPDQRLEFEARVEAFFRDYFASQQLSGWRDERYAVAPSFTAAPQFLIERAALSYLGIRGHGVHVNGYVEKADGLHVWVAKRSLSKPTEPGKLDQIVAGGIPHGISPMENVIKECEEEASIPRQLAQRARPVSAISYAYDLPVGLRPDVIFNYDLRLPADFTPQVNDDEVDSFELLALADLLARVAETQDFKFNCAVVIIDFAIRHGAIDASHPDYLALCEGRTVPPWRRRDFVFPLSKEEG